MDNRQASSADVAKISREVMKSVEKTVTSRLGREMAVKAAQALGRNPRAALRFMGSVGRVAGVAGVAAEVTQKVFDAGEAIVAGQTAYHSSLGTQKDINRGYSDTAYARRLESSARARVYGGLPLSQRMGIRASGWVAEKTRGLGRLGDATESLHDYLRSDSEAAVTKEMQRQAGLHQLAARTLNPLSVSDAVATAAARSGVSVQDMNGLARQEVVQDMAATQLQSAKNSAGADQYVQSQLASRTWSEKLYDSTFGNAGDQERKLREEFSEKQMKTMAKIADDRAAQLARWRAFGKFPESMSAAEAQQQRLQQEAAQAQARSFRSRHKAIIDD